jgi:hypothetical protein
MPPGAKSFLGCGLLDAQKKGKNHGQKVKKPAALTGALSVDMKNMSKKDGFLRKKETFLSVKKRVIFERKIHKRGVSSHRIFKVQKMP